MNKRGFTLIELLAAITVLAIIALVTTTTVTQFLKKGKEDLYQKQLNNIKLAAKAWASDHKDDLENTECYTLTLKQLQDSNYVDHNIINPIDGEKLDNKKIIVNITKEDKAYRYDLNTNGRYCPREYAVGEEVSLTKHGNEKYNIIWVGEDYVTLLKQEPLTVDEINLYGGVGTENNHINIHAAPRLREAYDIGDINHSGAMSYYTSETCGYPANRLVTTGCTASYNSSDVKYVVDNWASDKFEKSELVTDSNGYKARLITADELKTIGWPSCSTEFLYCELESITPYWIYNDRYLYWTMSPHHKDPWNKVWVVLDNGNITWDSIISYITTNYSLGKAKVVRPVINLKKSVLEGGNNNE